MAAPGAPVEEIDDGNVHTFAPQDREYLQTLGVRLWPSDDMRCRYCWCLHVDYFFIGLPSGDTALVYKCEKCGVKWVMDEAEGEYPQKSLSGALEEVFPEAERSREDLRDWADPDFDLWVDPEDAVLVLIREINKAIRKHGLPISRAERDGILAVALPVGPEDVGGECRL